MKGYFNDGRFHYLVAKDAVNSPCVAVPVAETSAGANTAKSAPDSFDVQLFDQAHCISIDGAYRITEGRGTSVIFPTAGRQLFLKDYRRGGMVRHLSKDHYLFTGLSRTRAFREFRLLEAMNTSGLAVPQPFACRVERKGVMYRASLIVEVIDHRGSLAKVIKADGAEALDWYALGEFIGSFGRQRIFHADLNTSNILMRSRDGENSGVGFYLIDFDRGRRFAGLYAPLFGLFEKRMLKRFHRSLLKTSVFEVTKNSEPTKTSVENAGTEFSDTVTFWQPLWQQFLAGYADTVKRAK